MIQIKAMKDALDHAGYTAPTRQHELRVDRSDQESICPERSTKYDIRWKPMTCPACGHILGFEVPTLPPQLALLLGTGLATGRRGFGTIRSLPTPMTELMHWRRFLP